MLCYPNYTQILRDLKFIPNIITCTTQTDYNQKNIK